jgi:hypothetical protein
MSTNRQGLTIVGQVVGAYFGPIASAIGGAIGPAIGSILDAPEIAKPTVQPAQDDPKEPML